MLYEIWSDRFRTGGQDGQVRPPIRFHAGLNAVLGTQKRSNSIGKSTFLLVIDFVFGGSDYLQSNAHTFVGEHEIYFTFRFDDTLHRFCRKTIDKDVVFLCENCSQAEEEARLKRIDEKSATERDLHPYVLTDEVWKVDDFCKFLFAAYKIPSENITFRNIVSRYFRVYGRPNNDEHHPLHNTPREPAAEAITALQKLFGETEQIKDLKANEKIRKEERDAYKAAQKFRLVNHITTQKALKPAQEELENLKREMTTLVKEKDREVENADLSRSNEAAAINRKLAVLRRNRSRLSSQLEALNINMDGNTTVTQSDIRDLAHYFPSANIAELEKIDNFHHKIRKVLSSEIAEEREALSSSISNLDSEINGLQEQLRSIGIPTRLPTPFLAKHADLSLRIRDLEEQIKSFQSNKEVDDAYKKARDLLKEAQEKELPRIAGEINAQMVRVSDAILGSEREAPRLDLKDGKSYTFGTSTNDGTGNNYKNMIIYDLSILEKTGLPAIIHDSYILTDIGDAPVSTIVKQYLKISKQVFIAFDKTQSYGEETDKVLNDSGVLYLSDNGGELYGWSWDHKPGNE